eukprot:scaffold8088_cov189-Alexandrium_tamarense.AAC.13
MAVAVMLRPSEALPMSPSSFSAPSRVAKSAAVQVQQHHGRYVSRASSRPDVFHHLSHQYHTYQHQHRSYTALYSSGESQLESPDEGNDDKSPKKWQQPIQSMKRIILAFLKFFINAPKQFNLYYCKLSKKGKIILGVQLLALGMVFGMGIKSSSDARARHANRPVEVGYSTFLDLVDINGKGHTPGKNPALKLENVIISKDRVGFRVITDEVNHAKALLDKKLVQQNDVSIRPIPLSSKSVYAMKPSASQDLIDTLREHEVPFRAASTKGANTAGNIARFSIFFVYLLFLRKMYQAMGGGGGAGGGSGAPGKLATFSSDEPLVKFEDIEGIDDAKFEVMELVDTLRNPKKYEILGARAPTGLLLEGPPGTGKTMLARATAATAGVPLLYCSGSDFVEMFVGRGAARVRKSLFRLVKRTTFNADTLRHICSFFDHIGNTFSRAAKLSPCIIFIDELDALGKSRDMGGLGASMRSNDEAEQTLNQLLACMDGLDSSRRVCVLAATNRREVLDPALIRPGRFDRIIKVTLPDIKGRERILRVHAKKLPGFTECKGIDEKRPG